MANRFTVEAVFKAVDRITAPVSRMQNRIGKFSRSFTSGLKKMNRGVDGMIRGMRRLGLVATVAIAAIGASLANVILTGATFEQTLVSAAAKFPGEIRKGTDAYRELEDAARDVGRTTEFTATQAAQAINFLAKAGFDAEESISNLQQVVDLATVSEIELGRASDIATDTLGIFGFASAKAAEKQAALVKITDIMVKTSTSANTSIEQMFEALSQGGPVAFAAGQSIETTAALIATMADANIKGTKAGTGLKNIMLAIGAPGSAAAKIFRNLKIDLESTTGGVRDAIDVFEDFQKALSEKAEPQQLAIFKEIFGKIPIAAAINLTNASEKTREFRDSLIGLQDTTKDMAAVMRDTFQGRLNSLKSVIESVKISIFGMTEGPLADLLDKMIVWVRVNEKLIATRVSDFILSIVNNIGMLVSVSKKFGIALAVFFSFVVVLKTLIAVMTVVNLVMAANPVVLITLAIIALISAAVLLIVFWDEIIAVLRKSSLQFKILGLAIIALLTGPIGLFLALTQIFPKQWEKLKESFFSVWDAMLDHVILVVNKILDKVDAIRRTPAIQFLANVGGSVKRFFGGGGEDESDSATAAQVLSPSERTARSIEEHRTSNEATVTLRADAGTSAEVTKGKLGGGIDLVPSGAF